MGLNALAMGGEGEGEGEGEGRGRDGWSLSTWQINSGKHCNTHVMTNGNKVVVEQE